MVPRLKFLLLAGLLAAGACGRSGGAGADPPAVLPGTLTLATYNIHNFFDAYDNPYTEDEGTAPKKPQELAELAEAIHLLNADVVVLEEVEFGGFLTKFNKERLGDMGYTAVESPTGDARGISVAVLSRLPVLRVTSHRFVALSDGGGPETHFARDLLRVDLRLSNGQTLVVYGTHLKSKLPSPGDDQSAVWRLAEAKRIVQIMRDEMKSEHLQLVALCGDFNDDPETPPRTALLKATTPDLLDPLAGRKAEDRQTFLSSQFHDSFDDVLLSPRLAAYFDATNADIVRGGVFETASDHRPVRVKLGK